jgi:hypothetical protein
MTRFSTDEFRFDLPGDWMEGTTQVYLPEGVEPTGSTAGFAIGRSPRTEEPGQALDNVLRTLPKSPDIEVELLRSSPGKLGVLDAWDLGFVTRTRLSADYMRLVIVGYYDTELHFCWSGRAAEREAIDARADGTLGSVRFLRR